MEKSLIERSIALHGSALGKLVAEEQGDSVTSEVVGSSDSTGKEHVLQKQNRLGISTDSKTNVKNPPTQQQVGTG